MANNLQAMSDADFEALLARRSSLLNTFSMGGVALAVATSFADPEGMQPFLLDSLGAVLLAMPIVYWRWLRPVNIEVRRRGWEDKRS